MWFVKDLKVWQEAEKQFARYLIDYPKLVSIEFAQWKFKEWDIKMTTQDKEITYEIKNDTQWWETWNVAIEFRYKWEASGIYESKADFIVYHVADKWWIQKRAELILRLCEVEKRVVKWWDWWQSELYLIKLDEMPNLFEPLNM